ncbi:MAG: Ribulose bisphosphate carboxylase, type III [candidate division WS6 bacterium GW2011_GWA2_37_6]|uniref:Ribulose bisphosphate carboxylase, type III n=1 Tax=candidate division WS6 bacterium GW2011_GWA2_37_6 TaxID=1619087 RepID=A0A0G0GWY3_9BACT|nr:MAG: Ribulose bisphosphate carboxylase, type III [candidate division WS6 bacterium GW2011_GWA2_37_6]
MAVQIDYFAPIGWKPKNPDEDYLIAYFQIALKDGIPQEKFKEVAATVAAESSTGTWTEVDESSNAGMDNATKYRAVVFDIEEDQKRFKIAYPVNLFEPDNMSGMLAGFAGNIGGMKALKGMRLLDVRFPKKIVQSFPGPKFGIEGMRDMLGHYDDLDDPLRKKMPIMGTVPKPKVGRTAEQQSALARELWTAGDFTYDFIKDDENLTSLEFNNFYDRARLVLDVQHDVENMSKNKRFSLLNITHSNFEELIRRAETIRDQGGRFVMIDVVTTCFGMLHSYRNEDLGLAIHAHRAMHSFWTRHNSSDDKAEFDGFSVSMLVLAKIYRLLGVDSLHTGSPKAKMEDYGESDIIARTVSSSGIVEPDEKNLTLGQNWFGMKETWPVASGGLHPGVLDKVVEKLGPNIFIQLGGGVLGHPEGIRRGVEAALEARKAIAAGEPISEFVKKHQDSALAVAVKEWGTEPRIVY